MAGSHLKQLSIIGDVVSWFVLQIVKQLFSGYCEAVLCERASSLDRKRSSKNVLVRLSWPLLLMCGSYVEELQMETTIIKNDLAILTISIISELNKEFPAI